MHTEDILLEVAFAQLNIPYRWGGNNPIEGFDCSGLVLWCLRSIGLWKSGDATAQQIYRYFKPLSKELDPHQDELPIGTLVFYGQSLNAITHIALCVGGDSIVEAGGGNSKTLTLTDAAKSGACVRVRPVTYRQDLLTALDPSRSHSL